MSIEWDRSAADIIAAAQSAEEAGALWVAATTLLPVPDSTAGRLLAACITRLILAIYQPHHRRTAR